MKKIEHPSDLMELVNGFRLSRVILTAFELKVFDLLDGKSISSPDLSALIGSEPRATDRLLNVLVGIGLAHKQHGLFTNSVFSSKFLVSSSPSFLGGLGHTVDLWRKWSSLTQVVKQGSVLNLEDDFNDRGAEWLEPFIATMHTRGVPQGKELASLLDLSSVKKTLDVGGGSGAFTFAFIEKNPGIKGFVFDLPNVVTITEKYIRAAKLEESVATIPGNYLSDTLGNSYDLILMSAIIHINTPEENRALVKKGADALSSGGQLVIMDHLMSDDRTQPLQGSVFAINMLVGTRGGDTYTLKEISGWMEEAGLSGLKAVEGPSGTQYLIGYKK